MMVYGFTKGLQYCEANRVLLATPQLAFYCVESFVYFE